MPSIKRKLCATHGIYETKRCEKCKKTNTKQYNASRDKENDKVYHSVRWRKLRKQQLMLHPLCINFDTCHNEATIADHIHEVKDGGEQFSLSNLNSMCQGCHNTKTAQQKRIRV